MINYDVDMNIFILDNDPKTAATMLCDKHVVKMILESAQMLCSALVCHNIDNTPYRATHKNHPCTKWAGHTRANFEWLCTHGIGICEEYTRRYNKRHKSQDVIEWCKKRSEAIPDGPQTPFAQAMPAQYKNTCPVIAYRAYYKGEKAHISKWKTKIPEWWSAAS